MEDDRPLTGQLLPGFHTDCFLAMGGGNPRNSAKRRPEALAATNNRKESASAIAMAPRSKLLKKAASVKRV